jgi:glucose/arabinose dehydrogenase
MQILHNTIDMPSNGRWALLISNTTGPNVVRNNIFYNRHSFRGGISHGSPADVANTDSDYNVLDRVSQDDGNTVLTLAQWQAQGHETHSFIAADTDLWVNVATADYHLKAGSPAIDQGQLTPSAPRDMEDHARPWGAGVDVGADEVVTANFVTTQYVTGLSNATAMQFAPDGRLFITQQTGQLRVFKNGTLLATPFVTLPVDSNGERGLLGVAFDPAFATNQFVYVYYTTSTAPVHNRVSRFTASGDVAVAGSEVVILDLNNLSGATNHNGGALHFGPDGRLYIAVGENATASNAQSMSNLLGKMLRINPDGTIPSDNPFFASATGNNRAIWTLGLRNPFTFAFQPGTGRMFINDVGQNTWEEINDGIAGSNYGWPTTEGPTSNPAFRGPLYAYQHAAGNPTGCAITGGAFYNPTTAQFPADHLGDYFFADFCGGWIWRFDPVSGTASQFATGISSPVDLKVTNDGSLYYLARGQGRVYRVQNVASQAPVITDQPDSLTVTVGSPASFSVTATGSAPLSYQWQRNGSNIAGATSSTYTLASAQLADNGARFRCVVSNSLGTATSVEATLTVTGNTVPTASITQPPVGTLYTAGDTVLYSGTGTDTQDGTLPPSAFTWQVDFHHDTHFHPFVPATSGSTSPRAPSRSPPPARRRQTCGTGSTSRSGIRAG